MEGMKRSTQTHERRVGWMDDKGQGGVLVWRQWETCKAVNMSRWRDHEISMHHLAPSVFWQWAWSFVSLHLLCFNCYYYYFYFFNRRWKRKCVYVRVSPNPSSSLFQENFTKLVHYEYCHVDRDRDRARERKRERSGGRRYKWNWSQHVIFISEDIKRVLMSDVMKPFQVSY